MRRWRGLREHRRIAGRRGSLPRTHGSRRQPSASGTPGRCSSWPLLGVLFWQQDGQQPAPTRHADFADVDTEVLTDDLPVVAYLDPGFEIWLYHHSPATAED